jgi:hypothetical protein
MRFDMKSHILRFAAALAVASAILPAIGKAQEGGPVNRDVLTQDVHPTAGGWFQSEGNLGNINFDISDSGVVAGNWSTSRNGQAISYYFQGRIDYPGYESSNADGVIAIANAALYEVTSGGGCLTCAYQPAVLTQTGTMAIEFTSTRTGRFIYNDTIIPVVAWLQGLPLIAPRDYSGDWLILTRRHAPEPALPGSYDPDIQLVTTGRLESIEEPDSYELYPPEADPSGSLDIAQGDRKYRFTCVNPASACEELSAAVLQTNQPCLFCVYDPRDFFTLFLKDNDAGQFLPMSASHNVNDELVYTIHNDGRYWKAYGQRDQILIRYSGEQASGYGPDNYVLEILMTRLPTGLFRTAAGEVTP